MALVKGVVRNDEKNCRLGDFLIDIGQICGKQVDDIKRTERRPAPKE